MKTRIALAVAPFAAAATSVAAEPPNVVTDILPVHSLVAQVMGDLGSPELILPPGASPHGFSMRPSQAAALEQAEVVFWIGSGLTPWMSDPLETLSADATVVSLLDAEGTIRHAFDEDGHEDHGEHGDHDDHGHDDHAEGHDDHKEHADAHDDHDHDEHDHEEHAEAHDDHGHDDHAEVHDDHGDDKQGHEEHADAHDDHGHDDHEDHAHHDHGEFDPHAWLDPENGKVWLAIIADTLSSADPENAATYRANADASVAELDALSERMAASLSGLDGVGFAFFHDAYVYVEHRFDIEPAMSLLDHEAELPGAQRIATLQSEVMEKSVTIAFSEPQYDDRIVEVVFEGTDVTTCEIDPLGSEFEAGPDQYIQSLERLAETMGSCGQ